MRSAVIGLGVIGSIHTQILKEQGTLVAVCDIDPAKLLNSGDVAQFTDYIELLDTVKPDVVHICTPHFLHADMIIEALRRNIHVLCEKPLCIKAEDIDRILQAEQQSSAQLGVCHQNRYNRENRYVKDYLANKTVQQGFGSVCWHRDSSYYASGDWRGKWDSEGGGVLINQALHTLDLLIWFCGMPDTVTASVSNLSLQGAIEVEDTATILCDASAPFTFHATNGASVDMPVEITLQADGEWIKLFRQFVITGDGAPMTFDPLSAKYTKACYGTSHDILIADFYDCIQTGRKFAIDGKEAAKVIRVILAAYQSNTQPVKL